MRAARALVRHIFPAARGAQRAIMVCIVCTRAKLPHSAELCDHLPGSFRTSHHPRECQPEEHQRHPGHRDPHPVRPRLHRGYALRRSGAAGPAVVLSGEHPRRRAALRHRRRVRPADAGRPSAGPLLRHGYHRPFDGGPLPGAGGVEIVPEAIESAKANAARMGEAVAARSRFFCADAGKPHLSLPPRASTPTSSSSTRPARAVTRPPFRLSSHVPPPGRLRELQPRHRRKRRRGWNRRIPHREGPAGGSVSEDEALRMCHGICPHEIRIFSIF